MSEQETTVNPVVQAVIGGTAPRPARMAAARGILPLPQTDLLEILIALTEDADEELSATATKTLKEQQADINLKETISSKEIAPKILEYFIKADHLPVELYETILTNPQIPDTAVADFARKTQHGNLLELISVNQQRLIRAPQIIDALIANPSSTPEAERRAKETKREFFEKERGAQQIADELRAQGKESAAEFIETAEFTQDLENSGLSVEDALFIASHIEIPDAETDDSWLSLDLIEEIYEETPEQREAVVKKIIGELKAENAEVSGERIAMLNKILRMGMKDRVKLAMKGDREARNILIRDPNRIVAQGVVQNPRITEQEVEKIASMRAVPEDVLRQIAANRQWARIYSIMHKLVQNPRTPLGNVMSILPRLQMRDLLALSKNRNVSDGVRKQALRIASTRKGG